MNSRQLHIQYAWSYVGWGTILLFIGIDRWKGTSSKCTYHSYAIIVSTILTLLSFNLLLIIHRNGPHDIITPIPDACREKYKKKKKIIVIHFYFALSEKLSKWNVSWEQKIRKKLLHNIIITNILLKRMHLSVHVVESISTININRYISVHFKLSFKPLKDNTLPGAGETRDACFTFMMGTLCTLIKKKKSWTIIHLNTFITFYRKHHKTSFTYMSIAQETS